MKKSTFTALLLFVLSGLVLTSAMLLPPGEALALNAPIPMPDYKMKNVSGQSTSLAEAKKEKGLLVIFSCNTCPYVKLSASRIREYSDYCLANQIGCVIVNSNEAQRTEDDSFEEMVKYYKSQKLKAFYTVDENSQLADAFGARSTPQCFLFDTKGLVYKGAIDDNVKDPSAVKEHYLKDAITAVIKNQTPSKQETKSIGCTIKRLE
ncbi:MAG: thioredoxin family protein [Sphingobacteriia bacterium]|jgi:thioredoxin-related protein|nr:thioredoxin family protein [Sphingobacteriia bacterium]